MTGDLKELKSQQRQIRSTFDGVKIFIQRFKREKHEGQIEARMEILEAAMKKLYIIRRKMEVLMEEADEQGALDSKDDPVELEARLAALTEKREAEHASVMQQAEDHYCELKSTLQRLRGNAIRESSTESSSAPVQVASSALSKVKLPEIRLPNFGGKTRDWVTFRDMFRRLIHRSNQLNEIDKFTYLRSSLVGEALQEIGTIEITAANYNIAWDLLQKRYENRKLIVKAHLDAFRRRAS